MSENDPERAVLHQLIVAAEPAGAAGEGEGSRQAADTLLTTLKARRPAEVEAALLLTGALRRLACCDASPSMRGDETPASPSTPYVAIADALAATQGAGLAPGLAPDLSRLHEHVDLRRVRLRVPLSTRHLPGAGPALMVRYLPHYLPLPAASGRAHAQTGGAAASRAPSRARSARAKLVWCEDETGVRHAQLLRARPSGQLDARRDALAAQAIEELSRRLAEDAGARACSLRLRAVRVLPLGASAGLYEWCAHCRSLEAHLNDEHARAYAEGRDRMRLGECDEVMRAAHAADAADHVADNAADAADAAPALDRCWSAASAAAMWGAGSAGEGGCARAGPAARRAWARVTAALTPQLHRWLLGNSGSPQAWLARRASLARSAGACALGGWVLGLGERAPHRLLLDDASAEIIHIHMQPLLLQRAARAADDDAAEGDAAKDDGANDGAAEGGAANDDDDGAAQGGAARGGAAGGGAAGGGQGGQRGGGGDGARWAALPFRLTRELVDAFGPAGLEGPFRGAAEATLRLAQGEACAAALLTVLEAFVDEPMRGWAAASDGAAVPWAHDGAAARAARLDAEVAVLHMQRRLGTHDGAAAPLSVESRVRELIALATNEEALAAQPVGWQPWL